MSRKAFDKFINKPEGGAKKKEKIRQEKKKAREEKNAWFEEQKRLARERKKNGGRQEENSSFKSRSGAERKQERLTIEKKNDQKKKRFSPEGFRKAPPSKVAGSKYRTKDNFKPVKDKNDPSPSVATDSGEMPLNKFIAWCGVCGRREAADLIKQGKVTVNGAVITNPPHRVSRNDTVKVNGKKISVQKNLVYILLNKPKDYITTTDDPEGRKTVMDLVKSATEERVFPVGRLDRNTTGVLLLTNDGEVAQRLTHPKYEVKKIYEVKLDKPVTKQHLDTIANGITLDDGFIQPDAVAYADAKDKTVIGIEIHSGRNRIVRRIFEKLGFKVKNLDRVMYGIFTKKNVDRGKWRLLSEKEIRLLKHLNTSFAPKKRRADREQS
ncbi:MAG: rRNA pseudouridine synthase [Chitinophagaceae bacterium]|nr:rRNA pseudouridine synthase [Chitinophagaceae bacterium]MCW5926299.1 rRNA pseudouridine synthase [Chitinophagaceae bacterium]